MPFASGLPIISMLIALKYEYELEETFLVQQKMFLQRAASKLSGLLTHKVNFEPGSETARLLQARVSQLSEAESLIDTRLKIISDKSTAIGRQLDAMSQKTSQAAKDEFGTKQGGGY